MNIENEWIKNTKILTDPLEDFRNNFFKMLEDEKLEKEKELKRKQKICFHKYTRFVNYNEKNRIAVCEKCNHAKWCRI